MHRNLFKLRMAKTKRRREMKEVPSYMCQRCIEKQREIDRLNAILRDAAHTDQVRDQELADNPPPLPDTPKPQDNKLK